MAAGQSPGKLAVCSLVRPITVRVPDGDRQATADPVLTAVQGHENRPAICRCRKIGIWQKSAKNRAVTAGFIILVTSLINNAMFRLVSVPQRIICFRMLHPASVYITSRIEHIHWTKAYIKIPTPLRIYCVCTVLET